MTSRKDRRAGARSLKRKVATRRPRKTLVVFCEGERTEPEYLDALKRQPSVRDVAAVDLRVETGHGGCAADAGGHGHRGPQQGHRGRGGD